MQIKNFPIKTFGWVFRLCCTLLISQPLLLAKNAKTVFPPAIVKRAQQSMVTIEVSTLLSAYSLPIAGKVNGVVVNKAKGYILTTCSLVGRATVGSYQVTFYNGEQTEAKLLYYDPWLDYALLKVTPTTIPKEVVAATLSRHPPTVDQPIFTFSQGKSHTYTVHTGRVSHVDHIDCFPMSQGTLVFSMDTKGINLNGAVVWNAAGAVIGLNYVSNETFALGLHATYISYALSFLEKETLPIRKHIGVLLESYPLADAIRYDQFPEAQQKLYAAQFPGSLNKVLQVQTTLQGTPAHQQLVAGDIIWAIDGKLIGPSLVDFDMYMNKSCKSALQLTIFRASSFQEVTVPLYDLEPRKIKRMAQFGGATFFELDDICSRHGGEPAQTLTLCAATPQTIFSPIIGIRTSQYTFFA